MEMENEVVLICHISFSISIFHLSFVIDLLCSTFDPRFSVFVPPRGRLITSKMHLITNFFTWLRSVCMLRVASACREGQLGGRVTLTKRIGFRLKASVSALLIAGAGALLVQARAIANDDPPKTAKYYRQQAAAAYKAKDFASAIDQLKKALEVLEANNPVFLEPTLGVLVQDTFFFIANSQWPLVDENARLAADDKLQDPVVLKMKL